jgi:hypothetical protein
MEDVFETAKRQGETNNFGPEQMLLPKSAGIATSISSQPDHKYGRDQREDRAQSLRDLV